MGIERLRSRFSEFPANRERQEVTWPNSRRQVRGLKFAFRREKGGFQVSHLPQGFFAFILKHVKHVNIKKSRDQVPAFRREEGGFQVSHLPQGFFAFILKRVA